MTNKKRSGRRSAKPQLAEILKKVHERNESAAVDIYCRVLLGAFGLIIALIVFIWADSSDKPLALVFLLIPVFPVAFGVADDFAEARNELLNPTVR